MRGLVAASHPLPGLAVTVFATALAAAAGASAATGALLAGAVLTGQLGIGWLNDLRDADLDLAAGRTDKPLVRGEVDRPLLRRAVVASVPACLLLSFAVGLLPGLLHTAFVASAWAYDLWLKPTPASPVPYLVSFGLLPAVAATAAGSAVSWALVAAAALLGVGGHFANTLADVEADALTDVRGLPQRLGPARSRFAAGACVVVACAVALGGGLAGGAVPVVLLVGGALAGAAAAVGPPDRAFRLVLVSAAAAVAGIVAAAF